MLMFHNFIYLICSSEDTGGYQSKYGVRVAVLHAGMLWRRGGRENHFPTRVEIRGSDQAYFQPENTAEIHSLLYVHQMYNLPTLR